jgi:hypothetical protein
MKINTFLARVLEVAISIVLAEQWGGVWGGGRAPVPTMARKHCSPYLFLYPGAWIGFRGFSLPYDSYFLQVSSGRARPPYQHAKRAAAPLPSTIAALLLHF